MSEVDIFLRNLRTKSKSKRKLSEASLKAWNEYTRGNLLAKDIERKHINEFSSWLEKEKGRTIGTVVDYLSPLAAFFDENKPELKPYILKKQRELKAYIKTMRKPPQEPMIFDVALNILKAAEELRYRLLFLLLAVEGMSNTCIEKLQVRHIDLKQRTYEIPLDPDLKSGQLHPYTTKIIETHIKKYALEPTDRLIGISERTIYNLTKKYAKRIRLREWKDVTPHKMSSLGKNNQLRELLIRALEKSDED
jgi:hypothetical protein